MYNYRLIVFLQSISKIFEKAILIQLTKYLDENNLVCKKQYGFRENHSTEYAALHIVDFLNYQLVFIYIHDIPNASKLFNFIMYAKELQKVYKWLLANKLKLNVAKTKFMVFSKRNNNVYCV